MKVSWMTEEDYIRSEPHTLLALECPDCFEYTEKPLAWLTAANSLSCRACGAPIEIKSGQNRALIDNYRDFNERWHP